MAKKSKASIPDWMRNAILDAAKGRALSAVCRKANAKFNAPENEPAEIKRWKADKAAWDLANPFPGEARRLASEACREFIGTGYASVRAKHAEILRKAKASRFTLEQLLKAVEEFK